jgi:TP901 family phage tail tape measure protein
MVGTGGGLMGHTFNVTANAAQAKAELASLQLANKRTASAIQLSWMSVNAVLKVAVVGFLAVAGATAASVMALGEFNKNLVHTAALGDLTSVQMAALGTQITELGKKYGVSSTVMAEGTVVLAKAGLTMEQLQKAMEPVSQLMMANALTFEQAAEIGVMSVNAFSKEYDDLTDIFDVSQYVAQQTLLDIEDLQQGLQYTASTAALAGVEFEELVSMMGVLSQNAMVAGVASRSMNRMLLSIVEHAPEVQAWADSMGLGVEVIKDGAVNISEIIPAFSQLDMSIETLQESMEIFSVRGMRAWGILIQHADDYMRLLEESKEAQGVLADTAQKQATSLFYIWGRIKESILAPFREEEVRAQVTSAMQSLEKGMAGAAGPLRDTIKEMVDEFAKWAPSIGNLMKSLAEVLKTVFGLIKWGVELVAGLNKGFIMWLLLTRLITRSKMVQYMLQMVTATKTLEVAQEGKLQKDAMEIELMNAKKMAYMGVVRAGAGIITGMFMMAQNASRWMKILGALIVMINAATLAYAAFSVAKQAGKFGGSPMMAGIYAGAIAGGLGAVYALTSPIKAPDTGNLGTSGMFSGANMEEQSFQRGTAVVTKPTFALLHPGEAVSSANKPLPDSAINIYVQGDLIDHDGFIKRLEKVLGERAARTRRNYI